jgi:hypothetical protein
MGATPKLKVFRIMPRIRRIVKLFQKLTLITAILGLIIPLLGVVAYVFINSIIGIPVLALFLGGIMLIAILIIAINAAALFVAVYLKNTRVVGIILICCGAILLVTVQLWGLPGLVLYIVSGVLALREKLPRSPRKYTINCLTCGVVLRSVDLDFAKDHLVDNPTHLEYRVVVELRQTDDTEKIA